MIENYYDTDGVIQRKTSTKNGIGGQTESWVNHLTLKGRLRLLNGDKKVSGNKKTIDATHRWYCDVVDILETDRLIVKGKTYLIKFIDNPHDLNRFLQLDVELVP